MPLIDATPFLQESTPTVDYLKKTLDTEDVVVFTDREQRSAFILAREILEGFEKKFTCVVLKTDPNKDQILELLDKITDNAELPHLFYKQKYVGGGREIVLQYECGDLEANLDVEPYMELPKMYPGPEDYLLREAEARTYEDMD